LNAQNITPEVALHPNAPYFTLSNAR
jgi:hypothetical protein